jgi:hypothetical protein
LVCPTCSRPHATTRLRAGDAMGSGRCGCRSGAGSARAGRRPKADGGTRAGIRGTAPSNPGRGFRVIVSFRAPAGVVAQARDLPLDSRGPPLLR